jgi:hypothetical protein
MISFFFVNTELNIQPKRKEQINTQVIFEKNAFDINVLIISADLFPYHEEHKYFIRGHGRIYRAGPLN